MKTAAAFPVRVILLVASAAGFVRAETPAGATGSLAPLLAAGPEGKGNAGAAAAWKIIVADPRPEALVELLQAMDEANPLARNWLRGAVYARTDREKARGRAAPVGLLTEFVKDRRNNETGRLLAAELLRDASPEAWRALFPGLLDDPSAKLRREPVQQILDHGKEAKDKDLLRQALDAARDEDQIKQAAETLRDLGETVDLPRRFGFLMDWKVIGPFENKDRRGYEISYPPEDALNFTAAYAGKTVKAGETAEVKWRGFTTEHPFGIVDFNKPLGMVKEATAYAATIFNSPEDRDAEIRIGCKNAWKVWLNGKLLFGRDEYHRGMEIDQYRLPVKLKQGSNEILVKCCQNEQTETWTVEWEFQLRVCDATGAPLLDPNRPPTPQAALTGKEKAAR